MLQKYKNKVKLNSKHFTSVKCIYKKYCVTHKIYILFHFLQKYLFQLFGCCFYDAAELTTGI